MSNTKARAAIEALENKMAQILSDRTTEAEAIERLIRDEAAAAEAATGKMLEAKLAGDADAYRAAKALRRDAEDAKEMHESRLRDLNEKPLISAEDYKAEVSKIYAAVEALEDQTKQQLVKFSNKMESAAVELQDVTENANKALSRLQSELFKDSDRTKRRNGEIMYLPTEDKKITSTWDTIFWGRSGVIHYQYEAVTGRKVQQ